jgi:hypothetical protein
LCCDRDTPNANSNGCQDDPNQQALLVLSFVARRGASGAARQDAAQTFEPAALKLWACLELFRQQQYTDLYIIDV